MLKMKQKIRSCTQDLNVFPRFDKRISTCLMFSIKYTMPDVPLQINNNVDMFLMLQ